MNKLKSWRTTLAGWLFGTPALLDALINAYQTGYFTDKDGWQLFGSIAFIVICTLMKDAKVSGTDDEEKIQRLIGTPNAPKTK
jgi:hypothetical protein